ncbi:MAG: sialidase family protein [Candidatus Aenigmatarchaeota archaeon]
MRKKYFIVFIFLGLFFLSIKSVLAYYCCVASGGSCTCSSTGGCSYTCNPGWFNDDGIVTNGCENQAPKWFTPSENKTNPNPGDAVKFSVNWTDVIGTAGMGLGINYTWFSWNASGANCDTWVNISFTPRNNVNSTWHNETQIIPSTCLGKKIAWKQYANDSAGEINVSQERIITVQALSCSVLDQSGATYRLTANVNSAGTCFEIKADSITLDCQGYTINYSQSSTGYAINNSGGYDNITIKNCNIVQGNSTVSNSYAIYASGMDNSNIYNNTITTSGSSSYAIYLSSASYNNITNNTITTSGSYSYAVLLYSSSSNTFSNNTITTSGSYSDGITILLYSEYNTFSNNDVTTSGSYSDAIYFMGGSYNKITGGSYIAKGGTSYDYYLESAGSTNNFTNTNFTQERKIHFYDTTSWFNYNNRTDIELWLKTRVSSSLSTIRRELIKWTQEEMKWNESASTTITAYYEINGLYPNQEYYIYDGSQLVYTQSSTPTGNLTFNLTIDTNARSIRVIASPFQTTTIPFYPNQRAICRDGKNYIHVVWKYDENTISYARSIDNGKTWVVNRTIVNSTGSKGLPSISCDGNNITIGYRNGTSGVVIYISENNGASFEEKVPYSSGIGEYVNVERRGQRIYVVYQDDEAYRDIEFFNSSDAGNTWGPIKVVFDGYRKVGVASLSYYQPSLVIDGSGETNDRIHVVAGFESYDEANIVYYYYIVYRNSSDSGANWSTVKYLIMSTDFPIFYVPSITHNGSKVYVSYYSSDNKIYFNSSSDYGSTWSGERIDTIIDTSKAQYPSVTVNSLGYPLVLWQQNDTTNNKRWNIIYRNNSGSWENPVWITTDIAGDNVYPNSKYQSKDCLEFVYRKGASSPYSIIYEHIGTCPPPITPPQYSLNSTNSTLAGTAVSHNLFWEDDYGLSGYIFSFDNGIGDGTIKFNQSSSTNITGIASTLLQTEIDSRLNFNADGLTWDITEADINPPTWPKTFTTQQVESLSSTPLDSDKVVLAWCDEVSKNINFKIYSTKGETLVDTVTVDSSPGITDACNYYSVSVSALNSTHFVIAWFDASEQDITFAVYDSQGSLRLGPIDEDTAVGTNSWGVSVSAFNSTHIVIGYYDYVDQDATFSTWNLVTQTRVAGPIDVDTGVSTDCYNVHVAALNSNNFVFFYYDAGATDDATFAIYTITGTAVKAATDEDTNIGNSYSLALTTLNSSYFVLAYYDAADGDITFSIYNSAGTRVVGPIDEDTDVGTSGAFVSVSALNSTHFVIAYYDTLDAQHTFSIYNWNTRVIGPIDVSNVVSGMKWISTTSYLAGINLGICNQNFVFSEVYSSSDSRFFAYSPSGNLWNGYCFSFYQLSVEHNSTITYPGTLQSISVLINFTSTVDDVYNMSIYDFVNSVWDSSPCENISVSANVYNTIWCNVTINPENYISSNKEIRVRLNSTVDNDMGTLKEEYVQFYLSYTGFINDSWVAFEGSPTNAWSNVTKIVNSTVGSLIRWRVYANDTNNNWNVSEIFSYITSNLGYLEVDLVLPLSYTIAQNKTFVLNATVFCRNGSCGNVFGTPYYNLSSYFPDTQVNTSEGDKPFYIQEPPYPSQATKACLTNPLEENEFCNLTWIINATGDVESSWKLGVLFNSSFQLQNHTSNSTITITLIIESISFSFDSIDFGFLTPNTQAENNPAPGNENNLYNITNTGTCELQLWIKGTDLQNQTFNSFIAVGNLSWSNSSNIYNPNTVYPLDYYYKLLYSVLPPNSNLTTYYWLSVPSVYAGIYKGTITICGNCSSLCD